MQILKHLKDKGKRAVLFYADEIVPEELLDFTDVDVFVDTACPRLALDDPGRLAVGAGLLGAKEIVGVDIDPTSISLARDNASKLKVNVDWIVADVATVQGKFDTVVMNPPYGTRKEHADIEFLEQSFRCAEIVYSMHKSSTRTFLRGFINRHGRNVDAIRNVEMLLPHLFDFHQKKWTSISVDLYRITS